jgi:diaminohydroxyphosphoribosylaminopyrimidine deaminase/5-amino-6-(5-phosphoribosylamino)uracil reductase
VEKGIRRVVVGMADPNPSVVGGGCAYLKDKGVEVTCGVLEQECSALNEVYVKHVTTGQPFVTVKAALTLDGWTATRTGDSRWITNARSRRFVHSLRKRNDAVMVGVDTVIADDPLLIPYMLQQPSRVPVRVIVDTRLRIPLDSRVLTSPTSALTVVAAGSKVSDSKKETLERLGVKVVECKTKGGRIEVADLLKKLAAMPITSVLVEGGAGIFDSVIRERLVDKFFIFLAPKLLCGDDGVPFIRGSGVGRIEDCLAVRVARVRRLDDDIMIEAYPRRQ